MLSTNAQAVLLLTSHFSKTNPQDIRPLTNKEWARFAFWLKDQQLTPEKLLYGDPAATLALWSDAKITHSRIEQLLNRGSGLALAVEKWMRAGIWVMTRSDPDYPGRLKKHLKGDSPPVLFGCGDRALLDRGGIAVVGSRDTTEQNLAYSSELGAKAAGNGYAIISGGARGVDESAMLGALAAEGAAVGVLADSLLRAVTSSKYRQYLMNSNLVLISPFHPESGFNVGNAMQRNKYIYCLSDAAIAVHSGKSGGTWNGVIENLKHCWIPMWVKSTEDPQAGNAQLVEQGARWLPSQLVAELDLSGLMQPKNSAEAMGKGLSIELTGEPTVEGGQIADHAGDATGAQNREPISQPSFWKSENTTMISEAPPVDSNKISISFYTLFLGQIETLCKDKPKSLEELEKTMELHKSQLKEWITRAENEGKLTKLNKPIRYLWRQSRQNDLFEDGES